MAIELIPRPSQFDGAQGYNVYEANDRIGSFDAGPYKNHSAALLFIGTSPKPGRGKSRLVLAGFKDIVGHGRDIVAPEITHTPTWIEIAKLELIKKAHSEGQISVVNHKILSALPIVHVLESGGIKVDKLDIIRQSDYPLSHIYHALIQSADRGAEFFETVIYART